MFVRAIALLGLLFAACEKTDHDSIDKWVRTDKGPGKLAAAVADEAIDADLSAHAAENLIKPPLSQEGTVREALDRMSDGRRNEVIAKLAPRLWNVARIENEMKLPNPSHTAAKDALFSLRKYTRDTQRQQIDQYLIDWYGVPSFDDGRGGGRSASGVYAGATVARAIGPAMGKKLIEVINGIVAAPNDGKARLKVPDELMFAIAASGSPEGVKKLLDVSGMDRGDPTLGPRAFSALYKAYVDPNALIDIQHPDALFPNLDQLVAIARDDTRPNALVNDAVKLIRAVGPPKCFEPLVSMVGAPHKESTFKYVAGNAALRCGGTKGIVEVVHALPEGGAYDKEELVGAIAGEIGRMKPRDQALAAARSLLDDKSVISRWVAIEALAAMKSVDDKPRLEALTRVKDRLIGYWGRDGEGKTDPTLGDRAKELIARMEAK